MPLNLVFRSMQAGVYSLEVPPPIHLPAAPIPYYQSKTHSLAQPHHGLGEIKSILSIKKFTVRSD